MLVPLFLFATVAIAYWYLVTAAETFGVGLHDGPPGPGDVE